MTKNNVGSLLVRDPSKVDLSASEDVKRMPGEAVVGLITERGADHASNATFHLPSRPPPVHRFPEPGLPPIRLLLLPVTLYICLAYVLLPGFGPTILLYIPTFHELYPTATCARATGHLTQPASTRRC